MEHPRHRLHAGGGGEGGGGSRCSRRMGGTMVGDDDDDADQHSRRMAAAAAVPCGAQCHSHTVASAHTRSSTRGVLMAGSLRVQACVARDDGLCHVLPRARCSFVRLTVLTSGWHLSDPCCESCACT